MDSTTTTSLVMANPSGWVKFTWFPKLPVELRRKIYKHGVPNHPRYIEIRSVRDPKKYGGEDYWEPFCAEESRGLLNLAGACKESREVVVQIFTFFKGKDPRAKAIYVDFSKDVICITVERCHMYFTRFGTDVPGNIREAITSVAVDGELMLQSTFGWNRNETPMTNPLLCFPNLKHFSFYNVGQKLKYEMTSLPQESTLSMVDFKDYLTDESWMDRSMQNDKEFTEKTIATAMNTYQIMQDNADRCLEDKRWMAKYGQRFARGAAWKLPQLGIGQVAFSDETGVEWYRLSDSWRCSLDESLKIPSSLLSGSDGPQSLCEDQSDCGPFQIIRSPTHELSVASTHFPCVMNTHQPLKTLSNDDVTNTNSTPRGY